MIALALALVLASPDAGPPRVNVEVVHSADAVLALPRFHAKGVHVVHFWATWCEPCREELPAYVKRARALAKHGVDFTFISVDRADDLDAQVVPFLDEVKAGFAGAHHVLLGPEVVPDSIADSLAPSWDGDIPVTLVYRDGKQLGFYVGHTEQTALDHVPAK